MNTYSEDPRKKIVEAPRNRGKTVTLLASMTGEGTGPCVTAEDDSPPARASGLWTARLPWRTP